MTSAHVSALKRQDFEVVGILGRGAFGVVYDCTCNKSGTAVAVKVISKLKAAALGIAARVINEVSLHCKMRHPHIVDLLDFFEDDENVYLVTEACTGGDMYQQLQRSGPLPPSEVQRLGRQLLSAIAYMHSQGILHRDLKLSNLLLYQPADAMGNSTAAAIYTTTPYSLKVADYGLAVQLSGAPGEEHRTICGTPNYIAPEVTAALPHGPAADVYSAGCLLYSMLFGRPPALQHVTASPATGASGGAAGAQTYVTRTAPAPDFAANLDSLPGAASALIRSLLAPYPGDRPTASEALVHDFFEQVPSNEAGGPSNTRRPAPDSAAVVASVGSPPLSFGARGWQAQGRLTSAVTAAMDVASELRPESATEVLHAAGARRSIEPREAGRRQSVLVDGGTGGSIDDTPEQPPAQLQSPARHRCGADGGAPDASRVDMQELIASRNRATASRTPVLRLSALGFQRAAPAPQPSPCPSPTSKAMHADVRAQCNLQQPLPRPQSALEGEVAAAARTSTRARLGSADSVGSIGARADLVTNTTGATGVSAAAGPSFVFGAFQLVQAEPLHSSPFLQASGGPVTTGMAGSAGRRTSVVGPWGPSSAGSPASTFSLGGLPFPPLSSQPLPPSHLLHMHTLASSQPSGLHDRTVVSLVSASPSMEAGPLHLQHALGGGHRASRPSPPPSASTVSAVDGVPSSDSLGLQRLATSAQNAIPRRPDAASVEQSSNVHITPVVRAAVKRKSIGEAAERADPSARFLEPAARRGAELLRSPDAYEAMPIASASLSPAPASAVVNGTCPKPDHVAEVRSGLAAQEAVGCGCGVSTFPAGVTAPVDLLLMEIPSLSLPDVTLVTTRARESTTQPDGSCVVARDAATCTRQSSISDDSACACQPTLVVAASRSANADGNASSEQGALCRRNRIHAAALPRVRGEEMERILLGGSCEVGGRRDPCLLHSEAPPNAEPFSSSPMLFAGSRGSGAEAQLLSELSIQSRASVGPAGPVAAGLATCPSVCSLPAQRIATGSMVDARLTDAMESPRHSIPAPACVPEYASIIIPRIAPLRSSPPLFIASLSPSRSSSTTSGSDGEPGSVVRGGRQNSTPANWTRRAEAPMVQKRHSDHESVRRARLRPHIAARDALTTRGVSIIVAEAAGNAALRFSHGSSDAPLRLGSIIAVHGSGPADGSQTTSTVSHGCNRTQRQALSMSSLEPRWLDGPSALQGASLLSTASSSLPLPPSASIHQSAVPPEWHQPSPPPQTLNRSAQTEARRPQRHVLHQDLAPAPSPTWASSALQHTAGQTADDDRNALESFWPQRPEKVAGAQSGPSSAPGPVASPSPSATLSSHAAPASFAATAVASDNLSLSASAAQWSMGSVAAAASHGHLECTDEARHSLPSPSKIVLASLNVIERRGGTDHPSVHILHGLPPSPSRVSHAESAPGASHLEPATRLMSAALSPLLLDTNLRRRYARQRRQESAATAAASAAMLAASTARSRIRSGEDVAASRVLQAAEGAWTLRRTESGGTVRPSKAQPGPATCSSVHTDVRGATAAVAAEGATASRRCPDSRTWKMHPIACDLRPHGAAVPALITCSRVVHGGRFLKVQLRGTRASCDISLLCHAAGTDDRSPPSVLRTLSYMHGSSSVRVEESAPRTAGDDGVAERMLPLAALPSRWARMYMHLAAGVASIRARLPRVAVRRDETMDDDVHGTVQVSSLGMLMDDGNPGLHSYSFTLRLQLIKAGVPHIDVWKMQYWPRRSHLLCVAAPWGESVGAYLALPKSSPALLPAHAALVAVASEPVPAESVAALPLPAASLVSLALRYHATCFAAETSLLPQLYAVQRNPPSAVLPVVLQPRERFLDKETLHLLVKSQERRWTAVPARLPPAALAPGNSARHSKPGAVNVAMSAEPGLGLRGGNGAETCEVKPGGASMSSRVVAAVFLGEDAPTWATLEKCSGGATDVASAATARVLLREPLRWLCLRFADSWRLLLRDDATAAATIRPEQLAVSLHSLRSASDTAHLPPEVSRRLVAGRSYLRAVLDQE